MAVGGENAMRSITKTAVGYSQLIGIERRYIRHLLTYLYAETSIGPAIHYMTEDPVYNSNKGEVIHLVHLTGDPVSKQLYCYVELFSSYSFLVLLNSEYDGEMLTRTYAYDLIAQSEVNKQVSLSVNPKDFETKTIPKRNLEILQKRLSRVQKISQSRLVEREIEQIVTKSIRQVTGRANSDQELTKDQLDQILNQISLRMAKFILHLKGDR